MNTTMASISACPSNSLATPTLFDKITLERVPSETALHDHLGQLLTYPGGHDANVVIWLVKEFGDEPPRV